MEHKDKQPSLVLPVQVTGKVDVGRLLRQAEELDNFLTQAAIREPGTPVRLPKTGRLLEDMIEANKLNVLQADERKRLLVFLKKVRDEAPVMHMSFSADPAPLFTQKLMEWLRREVHPLVLVQVGLQPGIGAGCIVRTKNKYFDFSLKRNFDNQRELLIQKLQGTPQPAPSPQTSQEAQV